MNCDRAAKETDALLIPFLNAAQSSESNSLLTQLLSGQAGPIVRGIIREKLHLFRAGEAPIQGQDEEDVYSDVMAQIVARLNALRSTRADPILDFRSYVATATFNACHQYLRRKYPHRWRLKNRLRYLLTHRDEFEIWEGAVGKQLCGFAAWRNRATNPATPSELTQLLDDHDQLEQALLVRDSIRGLEDLLGAIFENVGGPVEIDSLVTTIADLQGITDRTVCDITPSDTDAATLEERLHDPRVNVVDEFEQRSYLQRLWSEITLLPVTQRQALLLNLKDVQEGVIALLPLTGAATFREIAEALSMTAENLAELWNDLPLDDATIATRLGLTRQQVINLRKSARARLARRMKAFDEAS